MQQAKSISPKLALQTGYSTLWLAEAARPDWVGKSLQLKLMQSEVQRSKRHVAELELSEIVQLRVGDAADY